MRFEQRSHAMMTCSRSSSDRDQTASLGSRARLANLGPIFPSNLRQKLLPVTKARAARTLHNHGICVVFYSKRCNSREAEDEPCVFQLQRILLAAVFLAPLA